jgi:hypothetical protein
MAFAIRHPEEKALVTPKTSLEPACDDVCQDYQAQRYPRGVDPLDCCFFYDIFFVLSRLICFGRSIMIAVATSGGPPARTRPGAKSTPDDADCQVATRFRC